MRNNPLLAPKKSGFAAALWRRVWPSRPDPDKSRRVARVRLLIAGVIASSCFMGISAKAVWLVTSSDTLGANKSNIAASRPARSHL